MTVATLRCIVMVSTNASSYPEFLNHVVRDVLPRLKAQNVYSTRQLLVITKPSVGSSVDTSALSAADTRVCKITEPLPPLTYNVERRPQLEQAYVY